MKFYLQTIGKMLNICIICVPLFHHGYADNRTENTQYSLPPSKISLTGKVKSLSQSELAVLNEKLRVAMGLYYNHSYQLALPILNELANRVDTLDILYWLGRAAHESGQNSLAIEKFKIILDRDAATLPRIHLDLAAAYAAIGDTGAAKEELQKILAMNPPATTKQQVEMAMENLGTSRPFTKNKRFSAAMRASIGPEYDSNINVEPNDALITLPDKTQILTSTLDGWLVKLNFNGDVLYDFGAPGGFVWRNKISLLHNEYPDPRNSDFNYTQTEGYSALEYYLPNLRARLPVGIIDKRFANEALSRSFYLAPNVEVDLTKNLNLGVAYHYEDEEFIGQRNDDQSNKTHTVTFGPRYQFKTANSLHSLSFMGSYSNRNAVASRFSYHDWSIGPSYFAHFNSGTELYADFRYLDRNYQAPFCMPVGLNPVCLTPAGENRADQRYTASIAVSQTFYKHYFVSATYTYIRNASNTPLFDYDKYLVGINFGTNFDF
jgi:tetratricopeptide (TPR) repeat protein